MTSLNFKMPNISKPNKEEIKSNALKKIQVAKLVQSGVPVNQAIIQAGLPANTNFTQIAGKPVEYWNQKNGVVAIPSSSGAMINPVNAPMPPAMTKPNFIPSSQNFINKSNDENDSFIEKNKNWLIPVGVGVVGFIAYKIFVK